MRFPSAQGRVLVRLLAVVAAGLIAVGVAVPASACSCAMRSTAELADAADLIVRGRVTAIDRTRVAGGSADPVLYTIAATAIWKGPTATTYTVATAASGASCGLEGIAEGDDIVLFARAADQPGADLAATWTTSLCSGTGPASSRLAEVQALLGRGRPAPLPSTVIPVTGKPSPPPLLPTPNAESDVPTPAASSTTGASGPGAGPAAFPTTAVLVTAALAAGAVALLLVSRRR